MHSIIRKFWPIFFKFGANISLCNRFDDFVGQTNPIIFTPVFGDFPPNFGIWIPKEMFF